MSDKNKTASAFNLKSGAAVVACVSLAASMGVNAMLVLSTNAKSEVIAFQRDHIEKQRDHIKFLSGHLDDANKDYWEATENFGEAVKNYKSSPMAQMLMLEVVNNTLSNDPHIVSCFQTSLELIHKEPIDVQPTLAQTAVNMCYENR